MNKREIKGCGKKLYNTSYANVQNKQQIYAPKKHVGRKDFYCTIKLPLDRLLSYICSYTMPRAP